MTMSVGDRIVRDRKARLAELADRKDAAAERERKEILSRFRPRSLVNESWSPAR